MTLLDGIEQALSEQASLSAVEEFARASDAGETGPGPERYRALLPASPLRSGQQFAFEVDLDRCTSCKACVAACHSLNGLSEGESWRDTGLVIGSGKPLGYLQTITTACHHCLDPSCLKGCPTQAYVKDPGTGIVRHLDDQCFGCKYCMLTCPYDVPKYHQAFGIVRKCDMCHQRLTRGEAPACVQACPNQAIRITAVDKTETEARCAEPGQRLVPGAPSSRLTGPTTRYRSAMEMPRDAYPADRDHLRLQPAHLPLVWMLVLSQAAVGSYLMLPLSMARDGSAAPAAWWQAGLAAVLLFGALGVSLLHLGRPHLAFRAVLGVRTSWLSREILVFGAFAGVVSATAVQLAMGGGNSWLVGGLWALGSGLGAAGVFCSVQVYAVTSRPPWRFGYTATRFGLTTLAAGFAIAILARAATGGSAASMPGPYAAAILLTLLKPGVDAWLLYRFCRHPDRRLVQSARLQTGPLRRWTAARFACGFLCPAVLIGAACIDGAAAAAAVALGVGLLLAGELCERYLYFRSMTSARMPGALSP